MTFFLQTWTLCTAPSEISGTLKMQSICGLTLGLSEFSVGPLCDEELMQNSFADVRKATTAETWTTKYTLGA